MIDYKLCEYIRTIWKNRSFSKAAQELYVAQPSLSRYVRTLEESLGVELFDRKKIPLELTPGGKLFMSYIDQFEELNEKMHLDFLLLSEKDRKNLVIGTLTYLGAYILPKIIPFFVENYPNFYLDIKEHNGKTIEDALISGEIDICLTNLPPKSKKIKYCTVAPDKLLLVTHRTSSLEQKYDLSNNSVSNPINVDFVDFKNETFILLHPWQNMRIMAENIFEAHDFHPHSVITTSSIASSLNLLNCHSGYAFICESALQYAKINFPLVYFSLGHMENISSIILAYMKREDGGLIDKFCNFSYDILNENTKSII